MSSKLFEKCSCPIYWAIVPDKSGNYKNLLHFVRNDRKTKGSE